MRSNSPKLKPLHLFTLAVCSLAGSAAFAQSAATFEYRHPMTMASAVQSTEDGGGGSAETPEIAPTTLTLSAATLPEATVGEFYDFDFRTLLTIEGDEPPALDDINWGLQGLEGYATEEGPSLDSAGTLEWTPASAGTASFEVVATHEDAEGRQVFTIVVNGVVLRVTQISAGNSHTCAVTTTGAAKCWGNNGFGQLGDGSTTGKTTPVPVTGLDAGVASIAAGAAHTCAVTTAGAAKCWGLGANWRLGNGSTTNKMTPVPVTGLDAGVASIAAGKDHTCAVTTAGAAKCWGNGYYGQLGDGSTTNKRTPVPVTGLDAGVASITAGEYHTCAVTTAGAAKCWGRNGNGQLGDGSTTDRTTPVPVTGLGAGVASIAAGEYHTCAVTTAGAMKCWGYNGNGQLGDGSTTDRSMPVSVAGLDAGVASISAGRLHTCAVTTAGAAKCWGRNGNGQLGDGSTTDRTTPGPVTGLGARVASIEAGEYHTCAVTTTGGAKCWGDNGFGRLGDGSTTQSTTPVDVLP